MYLSQETLYDLTKKGKMKKQHKKENEEVYPRLQFLLYLMRAVR